MIKAFLIVALIASFQTVFSQTDKVKVAEIETKIWCDHCSECESCGQNIYYKIKKNKGIKNITIDDKTNTIKVKYNSEKTTVEEIEKAISKAGYKANKVDANEEAYKKLDNCCKKK